MSHLSGTYTYTFSRLEPMYNNSLETGCQSLVVGMNCIFSGVDANGIPATEGSYIDGTTGFLGWTDPIPDWPASGQSNRSGYAICYTPDYVSGNISGLANEYASGLCWCHHLEEAISGKLHTPVRWTSFPFPYVEGSGDNQHTVPGVNPHDM